MTAAARAVEPARDRLTRLAIVAVGVLAVVLTLLAASGGIRGSDQYWYAADVDSIVHGSLTTSTVFPVGLLGPNPQVPPDFIHNVLSLYLAAIPAFLVGSFNGWLTVNVLATLASAVLIYLTARRYAARWAAVLCAAAYPLLPITLWQTSQPLAEATLAAFAALFVFLVAVARADGWRWLAVVAAGGLLYLSRQSYLPILLAVPFGFLVVRLREDRTSVGRAAAVTAGLAVAAGVFVLAGQALFSAQNVDASYTRLLHTSVPGQTDNMWFNLDLSPANLANQLPFDLGLIVTKLTANLAQQLYAFDSLPAALFSWTFNILAIVAIVAAWRYRRTPRLRVVLAALGFVAIHLVTIALFQNQFRYTVPALPGLLVVLAMVLSDVPALDRLISPRLALALLVVAVVALVPDLVVVRQSRADGLASASVEAAAKQLLDAHVAPGDAALLVYLEAPQMLADAARPRLVVYVADGYTAEDFERVLGALPARWILAPTGSDALETLGIPAGSAVGEFQGLDSTWGLYRLPGQALAGSRYR